MKTMGPVVAHLDSCSTSAAWPSSAFSTPIFVFAGPTARSAGSRGRRPA